MVVQTGSFSGHSGLNDALMQISRNGPTVTRSVSNTGINILLISMSDVYQPCRVLKCRKHPPCWELLQTVCIFLSTGVQTTYLYCGGGSLQECSGPAGASEPILGGQRWERCRKGKPTHSVLRSLKNKQNLLHQPLAQTVSCFFTYTAKISTACWLICHFTVHGLSWLGMVSWLVSRILSLLILLMHIFQSIFLFVVLYWVQDCEGILDVFICCQTN